MFLTTGDVKTDEPCHARERRWPSYFEININSRRPVMRVVRLQSEFIAVLELEIGQSIQAASGNYYRIAQPIGEGKNARAYLCLLTSGPNAGCFFALKVLQRAYDATNLTLFKTEIAALSQLSHPSILQISDTGVFRTAQLDYPFYLCKYYPETLTVAMRRGLQLTRKLAIALQLVSGLAFLQSHSIVHCDIKPDNVFVGGFECALADFGLAKLPAATGNEPLGPSLHRYRSPDLAAYLVDGTKPTSKSDVFQLGLVLTELFTGKNICQYTASGRDPVVLDPIPQIHGSQSALIQRILEDMLLKNSTARPSAADIRDRWQQILFNSIQKRWELDQQVF